MTRKTRWVMVMGLALATACSEVATPSPDDPAEGTLARRLAGLSAPASAYQDQLGVVHIACHADVDCFAVQGYMHAAFRFVQMELRRRSAAGRLAELQGPAVLAGDQARRSFLTTRDGQPLAERLWAQASDTTRLAFEAYTRGVNAWLAEYRDGTAKLTSPSPPWRDTAVLDDWSPLDSVSCLLGLIESVANTSGNEIALAQAFARLRPQEALDMLGPRPSIVSTILPEREGIGDSRPVAPDVDRLRAAKRLIERAHQRMATNPLDRDSIGSNNWAVAPALTADGSALFANDPHLGLSNPATWFLVHLDAVTTGSGLIKAAGASYPGLPGVWLGHNQRVAWGATAANYDLADVYLETLNQRGDAVWFAGREVPLVERRSSYQVAGQQPVTERAFYVPHHGPVVAFDRAARRALSVRWTGQEASTDLNAVLGLAYADGVEGAQRILGQATALAQNYVVVDIDGHLGWYPYSAVPSRPWASAAQPTWLPVPGDGSAEWGEPVDYHHLPQATDPLVGYIATANNDMTGALRDGNPANDHVPPLQAHVAPGYRHARIGALIEHGRGQHTLATMQAIQADVFSLIGAQIAGPLVAELEAAAGAMSVPAARVWQALATWDYQCPSGVDGIGADAPPIADAAIARASAGCIAFHALFGQLRQDIFGDELAAAGVALPARNEAVVIAVLHPRDFVASRDYWDDVSTAAIESRTDILLGAMDAAGTLLSRRLGTDIASWRWGRLHTLTLHGDQALGGEPGVPDNGPYANDGGLYTVDVAAPSDPAAGDFRQRIGASLRLACQADSKSGVRCTVELPGGNAGDPASPYFDNMLADYLRNRPVPLEFDLAAARAHAVAITQFQAP
jgi:penicillin G amidase